MRHENDSKGPMDQSMLEVRMLNKMLNTLLKDKFLDRMLVDVKSSEYCSSFRIDLLTLLEEECSLDEAKMRCELQRAPPAVI